MLERELEQLQSTYDRLQQTLNARLKEQQQQQQHHQDEEEDAYAAAGAGAADYQEDDGTEELRESKQRPLIWRAPLYIQDEQGSSQLDPADDQPSLPAFVFAMGPGRSASHFVRDWLSTYGGPNITCFHWLADQSSMLSPRNPLRCEWRRLAAADTLDLRALMKLGTMLAVVNHWRWPAGHQYCEVGPHFDVWHDALLARVHRRPVRVLVVRRPFVDLALSLVRVGWFRSGDRPKDLAFPLPAQLIDPDTRFRGLGLDPFCAALVHEPALLPRAQSFLSAIQYLNRARGIAGDDDEEGGSAAPLSGSNDDGDSGRRRHVKPWDELDYVIAYLIDYELRVQQFVRQAAAKPNFRVVQVCADQLKSVEYSETTANRLFDLYQDDRNGDAWQPDDDRDGDAWRQLAAKSWDQGRRQRRIERSQQATTHQNNTAGDHRDAAEFVLLANLRRIISSRTKRFLKEHWADGKQPSIPHLDPQFCTFEK